MIPISISHKDVIKNFFKEDIKVVKKFFNAIDFDFDEEFKFDVFKEFIYSAAGMFKDLDTSIYNQELISKFNTIRYLSEHYKEFLQRSNFALKVFNREFLIAQEGYMREHDAFEKRKAEIQMLITKEQSLTKKRTAMEIDFKTTANSISSTEKESFMQELKQIRREQVDTIHILGTSRDELEIYHENLKSFENMHREDFLKFFNDTKDKLQHQFEESLNYFGYDFNEALFQNSERSGPIQRFKKESGIQGDLNLCKYVEYYLRNVLPDELADARHKERLFNAKKYCEKVQRKANFNDL